MIDDNSRPVDLLKRLITLVIDEGVACHLDGSLVHEIGPYVDGLTTEAKSAEQVLVEAYRPDRARLLDYGCGAAHHRGFIKGIGYRWTGVDYLESVSALARDAVVDLAGDIHLYDGRALPFGDRSFDVVYAMLVLHHLRHVDTAFAEISRVLDRGGRFIGQVSSMEQMQDYGTFNFTPFGLKVASEGVGLHILRIYPKHDVFTFLFRRLMITLGAPDDNDLSALLNPEGFFHAEIERRGHQLGLSVRDINLLRLKFCTQFVFEVESD